MKPSDGDFPITNPHIAIVGGGAAGLFTAMIIDYLNENTPSPGFNCTYDIYEASNPPKELNNTGVGGRLFTYEFMDNGSSDCRHKYFDVGAMRFPDSVSNPIMQR
jgi:protoporphyrinogen oxidase